MKPVKFSKFNQILEAHSPDVENLPVLTSRYGDNSPEIITCWQLSWWERWVVLFRGKLFVHSLSLHLPPIKASVDFRHVQEIEQWYQDGVDRDGSS
ncbi:MAG TPA: hypothetical protein V6C65_04455 [Allocoleopsis sp.]